MCATKPTPQASCSFFGSYRPRRFILNSQEALSRGWIPYHTTDGTHDCAFLKEEGPYDLVGVGDMRTIVILRFDGVGVRLTPNCTPLLQSFPSERFVEPQRCVRKMVYSLVLYLVNHPKLCLQGPQAAVCDLWLKTYSFTSQ